MANSDLIQSVVKACEVMKIVGHAESGIRLTNIAKILNQKTPAIHHLTRTLINCGFLKKNQDNLLLLGDDLIKLSQNASDSALREVASGEMQRLFTSCPHGVLVLAEIKVPTIEFALRISYERPYVLQKQSDQTFNIYVHAVGLASLAFSDAQTQELLMDKQSFSEYGAHLWKDWNKLKEYLQQIKVQGYAVSPFDQQTSFKIAAPIINAAGECKGALGVSLPTSHMKKDNERTALTKEIVNASKIIGGKL